MSLVESIKRLRAPLVAASCIAAWTAPGAAQTAPPPAAQAPPTTAPPPTPEELEEIQRALGADAKASPAPAPAAKADRGWGAVARAVASFNPDLAFIADFSLAAFSDPNLQAGGHDPTGNGFNLQGLELSFGADADPYFKLAGNIVFGPEEVELEEVYATTLSLPASLQVRAGQFFTRFGRINDSHPHQWDFVDQPLVIGKMMGPDGNRGLGLEVSWLSPLPWYLELVVSETMATGECCARSFYADDDQGVHGPQDLETVVALEQFHALSDDWSLATGLSFAIGPNPSATNAESYLLGGDVYLKYRPISRQSHTIVSLQAEGITRRRQSAGPDGATLVDTGLYGQLFWRFAQRWATAARYDYVTGAPGDPLDPEWVSERQRVAADVTFYPTEFSRLRLQGSADLPAYRPDPIYAAFLALEVAVGAPGAPPV